MSLSQLELIEIVPTVWDYLFTAAWWTLIIASFASILRERKA